MTGINLPAPLLISLPLAIPWIAGAILALLDGRKRGPKWFAVGALALGFLALLNLALVVVTSGPVSIVAGGWPHGIGIALRADSLGVVFAVVSVGVMLAALIYESITGVYWRTFPAVLLLGAGGLVGVFLTSDAFNFYVFFEIAMTSAFVLTGYREADRQVRGAFLFAIVNLLGSTLFLIAIVSLYTMTGTLDMLLIAQYTSQMDVASLIAIATLVFAAFSLKLGLFPFHFWLPTVYIGSHPSVAAILSGALANIGAYGLLRFGGSIFNEVLAFAAPVLIALGAISLVYGALQAVSRRGVSEVLAYSAIGQAGYIMLAIGIGGPVGFLAAATYAVINSLNKGVLFLTSSLQGAVAGAAFAIGAFSVAGIPPMAGFLGKMTVFQALAQLPPGSSAVLIGLVVLGSAMSILYMFQTYQRRFLAQEGELAVSSAWTHSIPALVLAALLLTFGFWPEPLIQASSAAGAAVGLEVANWP